MYGRLNVWHQSRETDIANVKQKCEGVHGVPSAWHDRATVLASDPNDLLIGMVRNDLRLHLDHDSNRSAKSLSPPTSFSGLRHPLL